MKLLTVLAAAMLLSACATDKPLMGTRGLAKSAASDPNAKVCQRSHDLGSNKVVRECHTQAESAAMAGAGQEGVQDMKRSVANSNNNNAAFAE